MRLSTAQRQPARWLVETETAAQSMSMPLEAVAEGTTGKSTMSLIRICPVAELTFDTSAILTSGFVRQLRAASEWKQCSHIGLALRALYLRAPPQCDWSWCLFPLMFDRTEFISMRSPHWRFEPTLGTNARKCVRHSDCQKTSRDERLAV